MAVWKIRDESGEMLPEGVHPVIQKLLSLRGIVDEDDQRRFFQPDYARGLHDPFLFVNMQKLVNRVRQAQEKGERIGVFGDYDVDGVTSSVLLRETLLAVGLEVSVYIPDKNTEGHGLHVNALDAFEKEGVTVVMTVDCGMTNFDEVAEANRRGMDVIIVDHHHVPPIPPEAFAIINPKMPQEEYPFKELCGAGTVFKVSQALYRTFLPEKEEQLKWLLDVAATGTVADCMPLIGENRVIVKYGLIVLSKTRRIGFQEMFTVGRVPIDENRVPDARAIGFQIGPRINAAGRMAHARMAHDLLMETDREKARGLASEIEALNDARRKISKDTTDLVREVAENEYADKKFIFAVDERYPFGIVGLVAGRIAHEFNKPTAVLQRGETESQGSFRSIPSVNIIEAIEQCSDLLVKFGGHAQAAGLTIKNEYLDIFYEKLNGIIDRQLEGVVVEPELWIDMKLSPYHVTPQLVSEIRKFAPFGEGNREPVFLVEDLEVEHVRAVGSDGKHLKLLLRPQVGGALKAFDAIGFNLGERFADIAPGHRVDAVFQLDENTWNGNTTLQLKLEDMRLR